MDINKDIKDLTKEEIVNPNLIPSVFEQYSDDKKRDEVLHEVLDVARSYRVFTRVQGNINRYLSENNIVAGQNVIVFNAQGKAEPTTESYISILESLEDVNSKFYFDELRQSVVKQSADGDMVLWTDSDDSALRCIIEKKFGVYNQQKYYDAFNYVSRKRSFHPIKNILELEEWDGIPRIDRFLTDILNCEDNDYSREVSRMIFYGGINRLYHPGCKFDYMPIFISGQGCVDCDTEYFNGKEWKAISEYQDGDMVLQYNTDGSATLVKPFRYLKQESNCLWEFKTKYNINQCLSDEHIVYYLNGSKKLCSKRFEDIRTNQSAEHRFNGKIITAFDYSGSGISLSNEWIRLMIAVFADGSYYSNVKPENQSYNTCRFHLKKERKKERLRFLCKEANVELIEKQSAADGYTDFYITTPFRSKQFPSDWYNCNKEQLEIIFDEIFYWDGCYTKKNDYTTTNKQDADFIQFVFTALGKNASIYIRDYVGKQYKGGYIRKSKAYSVRYSNEYYKTLNTSKDNYTKFNKYIPKDGYEYCFTVPSGMLVLRRNNSIFVTGNCGKTTVVKWLGLEKYYTDVYTIDGKDGMEVLDGAWVCEMGELLAMTRTKEIEAMKAYITRTVDKFRSAYGRRTTERYRSCIFIGTTNEEEFLIDKTGNRRYLPIRINSNAKVLFEHKDAIQKYILYCWREALYLMRKGETYLTIDYKYGDLLKEKQDEMTFDDPRLNTIRAYLMDKPIGYKVCLLEIYTKCLNGLKKNYSGNAEGKDLGRIMKQIKGWKREPKPIRLEAYGPQKCWIKTEKDEFEDIPIEKNEG